MEEKHEILSEKIRLLKEGQTYELLQVMRYLLRQIITCYAIIMT